MPPRLYATLTGAIVVSLVAVGIASHGLPSQSAYIQIIQLLALWIILSDYRTVIESSRFNAEKRSTGKANPIISVSPPRFAPKALLSYQTQSSSPRFNPLRRLLPDDTLGQPS
jgi:hypothetical protein